RCRVLAVSGSVANPPDALKGVCGSRRQTVYGLIDAHSARTPVLQAGVNAIASPGTRGDINITVTTGSALPCRPGRHRLEVLQATWVHEARDVDRVVGVGVVGVGGAHTAGHSPGEQYGITGYRGV